MKVAWFQGDCRESAQGLCMDDIVAQPNTGDYLELVLVPCDTDLTKLYGDDWDDAPADCNAGPPYERTLPEGSMVLRLRLGDQLVLDGSATL